MANMTTQEILQGIKDWAAPKVIYDISAAHNNTKYTDLSDALGTNGGNIPQEYRKGGITVRFVRTNDNKYVQFRYKLEYENTPAGNASFVNTDNWAICEDSTLVECPEFIAVYTDADGKIIVAVENDGNIYYGAGVPQQVIDYINEKIAELSLDEYEDMVAFLDDLEKGDKTLRDLLNEKVDKEEGKSLIDAEYAEGVYHIENPEFVCVWLDGDDKILFGVEQDGNFLFGCGVPRQVKEYVEQKIEELSLEEYEDIVSFLSDYLGSDTTLKVMIDGINATIEDKLDKEGLDPDALNSVQAVENPEFIEVELDADDKVLSGRKVDGTKFENNDVELNGNATVGGSLEVDGAVIKNIEDPENRSEITLDAEEKIINYRKNDGTLVENVGIESPKLSTDSLNLSERGMTEFQQALKNSGFSPGGNYDFSDSEFVEIPMPTSCALVNIGVDSQAGAKGLDIETTLEFYWGGYYFKKPIILNAQGDSSMTYWIKNQGFDINDGSKIKVGSWIPQDSFHLKKFYIDAFRGQSVVAYWLTEQVYKTRSYGERRPWDYLNNGTTTTNGIGKFKQDFDTGALSHPDGFPVHVFFNGKDAGIYSFNLKKHRDNYCMKKDSSKNIILDGKIGSAEMFLGTIDWTAFEIRNPKSLKTVDGNKYDGDNPTEITGDPSVDATTAQVKGYIERLSGAYTAINNNKTKATFEEYFLSGFFIDYFLISNVVWHQDGFWKNWIWCTWDGNKWAPTIYDLDSIFGMYPNGTHIVPAGEYQNPGANVEAWTNTNTLLGSNVHIASQLWYLYKEDIKLRYKELRDSGVFTTENIVGLLEKWLNKLGYDNLKNDIENVCAYEGIPQTPSYRNGEGNYEKHPNTGGFYNSIMRVKEWLDEHFTYLDSANIFNYNQN